MKIQRHINPFICLLMLFVCLITVLPISLAYGVETVRIGVLAFRPKPQTLAQWQPLAVALKQAMPERNFIIEVLTFPEIEAALASRKVDFVLTNPGHYVSLVKRLGLSAPLATLATYENGLITTEFGGVIFSRVGQANLNTLSDIKGKTVAVTSTDSMGGYQMQASELGRIGVHLPQDARLIATGMPHDNVVQAVLAGRADVGFVRTGVLEGMVHEGILDMKQIKIINYQYLPNFPWQLSTQLYPEWPFAALSHIDENLARHVTAAIFMLEENTTATHAMGIHGFVVPSDYTPVVDLLKELRSPPFDEVPKFTFNDIWVRYFWQMTGILLAIGLILLLGVCLLFTSRKLKSKHRVVLLQKQQLQESEAHLNAIIENEPECIKILDKQGRLIQINPAGLAMIEADSLEQVAGRSLLDVILPEYHKAFVELHRRVLAGEIMNMEFEVQGFKGGHRWLKTRVVPMHQKDETVLLGVTRDITLRKQTENALRKSHEKMQSILQSMAEGAYGVDIDGNCTFVNKSFLKTLGYEQADEIIGKHIHELIHHSHADGSHYPAAECQMYAAYQRNAEIHCTDEVFWHKDGKAIPVEYRSRPIVLDGVMTGAIATFIDITERKKTEEAIQAAALYSRSLIEASLDPLVTISIDGKITDANAALEQVTGINRDLLIGSDFAYYFTEPEKAHEVYQQVFSQGAVKDYPLAIRHLSGKVTDVLYNATLYRDGTGKVVGVFAAARDVTGRKAVEVKLRMLSTAIEQSPTSVVITNLDGEIQYVNPCFTRVTGFSLAEAIEKNPRILQSGLTKEIVYDAMWDKLLKGQPWVGEFINRRKNGEIYYEEAYISPVKEDDGTVSNYVAVKLDVTARKQMEEEVRQLAFYDSLTNLPNRRLLNDRLSQVLSAMKRSGCYGVVMFLDLDNFKSLNDTHGHVVGDLLLIEAANRLVSCIREMDTVARFGGDEFVVMLAELDEDQSIATLQAEIVAEKIRITLSEPYVFTILHNAQPDTTVEHRCTSSIGVMVFNGSEGDQDDIMKWADAAMYKAKDAGGNLVRFYNGKA
jgi:diguanylate cyclase (GGDEF)-like protein/PAS domain S-box-containing protein